MVRTAFSGPFRGLCFAFGLWWTAVGAVFLLAAAIGFLAARGRGTFPRRGAYALCRHPFPAWLSLFALPAAALLSDDAVFLALTVVSFIAFSRSARGADERLSAAFGDATDPLEIRLRAFLRQDRPFSKTTYPSRTESTHGFLEIMHLRITEIDRPHTLEGEVCIEQMVVLSTIMYESATEFIQCPLIVGNDELIDMIR